MKKKKLITLCTVTVAIVLAGYGGMNAYKTVGNNNLLMENVEALSESEPNDCDYKNGYTAFSSKKGGAYDCCKIWVSNAPENEHCR